MRLLHAGALVLLLLINHFTGTAKVSFGFSIVLLESYFEGQDAVREIDKEGSHGALRGGEWEGEKGCVEGWRELETKRKREIKSTKRKEG